MGTPKGFVQVKASTAIYRDKDERVKDYDEVEIILSDEKIIEQTSRCMDCGIPFCHGSGCPLGNLIPEWNEYAFSGHWKEALEVLLSTDDFPEFTGRVCPALCEGSCTAGLHIDPVSIRQIELALVEKGFREGWITPQIPNIRTGKKVAIIGSGPAGLSTASRLNKMGHSVTVYERDNHAGGLLRYGIPDFKLQKKIVQRRIELMKAEGVTFETGVDAGVDITANFLLKKFDAICITIGAKAPRDITIKGRNLNGIHFAMEFLSMQNKRINNENLTTPLIDAKDKNVLVIGGGDTGSDCVGTSSRHGAKSITQIEIMPQPPEARSPNTPWPLWPYRLRTSSSHKEGCNRMWNIQTKEFLGENGVLKGVKAVKVEWNFSESGVPMNFKEIEESEFIIDADLIFLSMGFTGVEKIEILNQFGAEIDKRGNIKINTDFSLSSHRNVFAAGDGVSGASLVVRAMEAGKITAKHIDAYLKGI